ncbi:hypothetical protein C8J56DRAFT_1044692 [Mycena floridula]|nr:hypothetical protein C8J56DRAFT_1044692 [Mycena floridula]
MSSKTAIVTGASSGIGRESAIALSAAGWNVVVTGRRADALEETKNLSQNPEKCLLIAGDVTDETFVQALFEQTVAQFGRLDLLFNNAGTNTPQVPIEEMTLENFQNVLNVNLVGPFICTREAFKVFKRQSPPGGRIINNGSLSAYTPRPHSVPYSTSKHAISGLTKCTALDGRAHNITCTQIDIGNALTAMSANNSKAALQPNGSYVAEATMDAKHVADTVVHIAGLPNEVMVLTINIMATGAPFVGRG